MSDQLDGVIIDAISMIDAVTAVIIDRCRCNRLQHDVSLDMYAVSP
jgi:hypothetical protein